MTTEVVDVVSTGGYPVPTGQNWRDRHDGRYVHCPCHWRLTETGNASPVIVGSGLAELFRQKLCVSDRSEVAACVDKRIVYACFPHAPKFVGKTRNGRTESRRLCMRCCAVRNKQHTENKNTFHRSFLLREIRPTKFCLHTFPSPGT